MEVPLWIVQSLLAAAFLALGTMKLVRTRARLTSTFTWVRQCVRAVR